MIKVRINGEVVATAERDLMDEGWIVTFPQDEFAPAEWWPDKGGAWTLDSKSCLDKQIRGYLDFQAPRDPRKLRRVLARLVGAR